MNQAISRTTVKDGNKYKVYQKSAPLFYKDENGDLKEGHLDGMISRVFQHEYDHMLGANFTHRVSKLKLERGMKAMAKKHKKYQRQMRRYLQA